jgi:hypothetical protein
LAVEVRPRVCRTIAPRRGTDEERERLEDSMDTKRGFEQSQAGAKGVTLPRQPITMEDAYHYQGEIRMDLEKAIRCAAYLLQWGSETGNEPINGWFASGLSELLRKAADETSMLFTVDEVHALGGNPFKVFPVAKKAEENKQ